MYESWLALFILNMASVIQLAQQVYMALSMFMLTAGLHLDVNPRRAWHCAARVTVHVLCVGVVNISLFTFLFMPQTILTFSAADEGRNAIFPENASLRS